MASCVDVGTVQEASASPDDPLCQGAINTESRAYHAVWLQLIGILGVIWESCVFAASLKSASCCAAHWPCIHSFLSSLASDRQYLFCCSPAILVSLLSCHRLPMTDCIFSAAAWQPSFHCFCFISRQWLTVSFLLQPSDPALTAFFSSLANG